MAATYNWCNEEVFKLIDLFQERECLWNLVLPDYKDRIKKHNAWMEIADALSMDKQTVEKKMRSLIGQFQRECKSGPQKWFAFKKLLFLKDRPRPGMSSDSGMEESMPEYHKVEVDVDQDDTISNEGNSDGLESDNDNKTVHRHRKPQKRSLTKYDGIMTKVHQFSHGCSNPLENEHEFDIFGKGVAAQLKNMPLEVAVEAQMFIQNYLSEVRLRSIQNNSYGVTLLK